MCQIIEKHASDTRNQEIVDRWKRKAVCLDEKLLVVEDHNGTIGGTTQIDAMIADHRIHGTAQPFVGPVPPLVHVVAHTRHEDRGRADFLTAMPASGVKLIILQVSGAGPVREGSAVGVHNEIESVWLSVKDRAAYCDPLNRWVKQFLKLEYSEAEDIAKIAKEGNRAAAARFENDYANLLDLLLPGRVEHLLAYRLLREARDFCGAIASKPHPNTGLTIHAPKSLEEWWKPFDSEESKAIRSLAHCIVDEGDHGDSSKWNQVKTCLSNNDANTLKFSVAAFFEVPETTAANV